jgi:hypothetical protein
MTYKSALIGAVVSLSLAAAPLSSASARGFHHGGGRDGGLVIGLAAAAVVGAVTLATAPFRVLAAPAPVYAPAPAYYPPPPYAYAPTRVYVVPGPVYAVPPRYVYTR